jgi:hypothetical protein
VWESYFAAAAWWVEEANFSLHSVNAADNMQGKMQAD